MNCCLTQLTAIVIIKSLRSSFTPIIYLQGLTGGTTISGTMVLAHAAGIRIFVSGGLGGVHRGGETTLDVSADLTELSKTPVALVTSGMIIFNHHV